MSQARAKARVASARSPAGAVFIQLMNCRTIIVLPAYAKNSGAFLVHQCKTK
jgi:hypothetical protein